MTSDLTLIAVEPATHCNAGAAIRTGGANDARGRARVG
jgi:hypothetical protein